MNATPQPYIPDAWEKVNCPFCNAADASVYERFGSALQYTYVWCNQCRLIYQSPRPVYNQHFIDACYKDYYQYADNITINDFSAIRESGVAMFQKEVAHLMQFDKKRTAVLDIGSGMGTFLFAAKPHYPIAIGLDVSEKMGQFVSRQMDVPVHIVQFEQYQPEHKFSLIHMSHVVEHVPNPNEWLQKAKELLEPGGILVINVPNKRSMSFVIQHIFVKLGLKKQFSSSWSDPARTPDHLFEPTVNAMRFLVEKNGYAILDHFTYSRKDPVSKGSFFTRFMNRQLFTGSNLSFIVTPK